MIEAVILDWAGTTVDFGSMAPVEAFRESFAQYGIEVTNEEIRKPMGMLKIDHIRTMLNMPRIYDVFCEVYGRAFEEADVQAIYASFHGHLMQAISAHTKVKPYVLDGSSEKARLCSGFLDFTRWCRRQRTSQTVYDFCEYAGVGN